MTNEEPFGRMLGQRALSEADLLRAEAVLQYRNLHSRGDYGRATREQSDVALRAATRNALMRFQSLPGRRRRTGTVLGVRQREILETLRPRSEWYACPPAPRLQGLRHSKAACCPRSSAASALLEMSWSIGGCCAGRGLNIMGE